MCNADTCHLEPHSASRSDRLTARKMPRGHSISGKTRRLSFPVLSLPGHRRLAVCDGPYFAISIDARRYVKTSLDDGRLQILKMGYTALQSPDHPEIMHRNLARTMYRSPRCPVEEGSVGGNIVVKVCPVKNARRPTFEQLEYGLRIFGTRKPV